MSRTPGEARHTHNILDGTSGARTRTSRLRNGNATARPHRLFNKTGQYITQKMREHIHREIIGTLTDKKR